MASIVPYTNNLKATLMQKSGVRMPGQPMSMQQPQYDNEFFESFVNELQLQFQETGDLYGSYQTLADKYKQFIQPGFENLVMNRMQLQMINS